MIAPSALGAPRKFSAFHPQQQDVINRFRKSSSRFFALSLPTGSGKSFLAWALAAVSGMRTLILTASRQLQNQYLRDFENHHLVDIRGQQNYVCRAVEPGMPLQRYSYTRGDVMCDKGPCHHGVYCKLMQDGCDYYDSQRIAAEEQCVLSNYSYWMTHGKLVHFGILDEEPIGSFELVICDEADEVPKEMSKALKVELDVEDARRYVGMPTLREDAKPGDWSKWASKALPIVTQTMTELRREVNRVGLIGSTAHTMTRLARMREGLERVSGIDDDWTITASDERARRRTINFEAVRPARYCEELLYRGAERVALMSSTLTERDISELGAIVT